MSTSKNTFTQVRDILKKLDQSIDSARAKRMREEKGDHDDQSDDHRRAPEEQRRQESPAACSDDNSPLRPGRAMPKSTGEQGGSHNPFQRRVG